MLHLEIHRPVRECAQARWLHVSRTRSSHRGDEAMRLDEQTGRTPTVVGYRSLGTVDPTVVENNKADSGSRALLHTTSLRHLVHLVTLMA